MAAIHIPPEIDEGKFGEKLRRCTSPETGEAQNVDPNSPHARELTSGAGSQLLSPTGESAP